MIPNIISIYLGSDEFENSNEVSSEDKCLFNVYLNDVIEDVVGYAYRKFGPDAQDILQKAILKAFLDFPNLIHRDKFKSWLIRIVHNTGLDYLEKEKKHRIGIEDIENIPPDNFPSNRMMCDPYQLAKATIFMEACQEHLNEVDIKCQICFALHDYEEFTFKEIGEILGIKTQTAVSRRNKAKKYLEEKLASWIIDD